MYNLHQLQEKEMDELLQIAEEMGINPSGMDKDALVFRIIDDQAVVAASSANEQPERKKRQRVTVKNVDRVFSANGAKGKKIDKSMTITKDESLFADLSKDEQDLLSLIKDTPEAEAAAPVAESAPEAEAPAPKKRGRKSAAEKKAEEEAKAEKNTKSKKADASDDAPEAPAPKKRGRKSAAEKKAEEEAKAQAEQQTVAEPVVADVPEAAEEEEKEIPAVPEQMLSEVPEASFQPSSEPTNIIIKTNEFIPPTDGTDFIIIEDIPAENTYGPVPLHKNMEQARQENNDARNSSAKQQKRPAPAEKPVNVIEPAYQFDNIIKITGVLDTVDNYGFLRSSDYNYLPSPDDVYVSPQQVKQFGLKNGDVVEGFVRPPRDGERFFPLTDVVKINGCDPAVVRDRIAFEFLTPLFPDEKFKLCKGYGDSYSSRIVDLFAPIGKGQRALIVAQPKTGKTLLMKDIANSIAANHPDAYLMMLLIDERPEEVTDMARTVNAEVIASTFDAPAENHVKIAGIVLEKAKRMVECGHDVVIFLDSITRLARAYNTVSPASGKVLSGGVDANALHKPKRFFGAARNIEGGGSLTIIATALIDTGSKMDEVIFEEFKGTGNMELQLDRSLANKRIFPAVNLIASSTRRDDLLHDQNTLNRMWVLRKHISDMTTIESMNFMLQHMNGTKNNEEFLISMNG